MIPNYHTGMCCKSCKCGYSPLVHPQYWCKKHKSDILETGICDDYDEVNEGERNPFQLWTTEEVIEHEKYAADAERKKVLDELVIWCKDIISQLDYPRSPPETHINGSLKNVKNSARVVSGNEQQTRANRVQERR